MTVEQRSLSLGIKPSQQWNTCAQLVYYEDIRFETVKLVAEEGDGEDQVNLTENGKEDVEAIEEGGRKDGVASNSNI